MVGLHDVAPPGTCPSANRSDSAQGNLRTATLKAFPAEEFERITGSLS
jgi:uncharacterized protein with GYD domain